MPEDIIPEDPNAIFVQPFADTIQQDGTTVEPRERGSEQSTNSSTSTNTMN